MTSDKTPTTIRTGQPYATLINVFAVEPARQAELVQAWIRVTDEHIQHLPGFISANVHASADGHRVINYAQWDSADDFTAMLTDPEIQAEFAKLADIAISMDPRLYSVESVHHR